MHAMDPMTAPQRAQWLADHLTGRQVPATVARTDAAVAAAQVQLTLAREPHTLYVRWADERLVWELTRREAPAGAAPVLASQWQSAPGRAAQHVRRLITGLGATIEETATEPPPPSLNHSHELGGLSGAGRQLHRALVAAGLPTTVHNHIDGVPTITVGVEGGQIRITGRDKTLRQPTGWTATLHTYAHRHMDAQAVPVYEGGTDTTPSVDTAACVAAVGALVAVSRHRRTTTVGARIQRALAARGIDSAGEPDHDALIVPLADGTELGIGNADGSVNYQAGEYYAAKVWHSPTDPREGHGDERLVWSAAEDGSCGLDKLNADMPVLLGAVALEVSAARARVSAH